VSSTPRSGLISIAAARWPDRRGRSPLPEAVPVRHAQSVVSDVTGLDTRTARPVAGHRLLPHTADCIIEAWGPDRASCLTEALQGLVEEFADGSDAPCAETLPLGAGPGQAKDLLVDLLEDVIYVMDVFSVVPVRFHLAETQDGGVAGDMEVVPLDKSRVTGAAPKAVAYHGLSMSCREGVWRCHVLIDV
jgi:SHS2 domain-containing protein